MVLDALELVDPILQLRVKCMKPLTSQNPNDLDEFLKLHDSILWTIYHLDRNILNSGDHINQLTKAQNLINRIFNRNLFTYIDSIYEVYYLETNKNSHIKNLPDEFKSKSELAKSQTLALRSLALGLGPRKSLCHEPIAPNLRTFGVFMTKMVGTYFYNFYVKK